MRSFGRKDRQSHEMNGRRVILLAQQQCTKCRNDIISRWLLYSIYVLSWPCGAGTSVLLNGPSHSACKHMCQRRLCLVFGGGFDRHGPEMNWNDRDERVSPGNTFSQMSMICLGMMQNPRIQVRQSFEWKIISAAFHVAKDIFRHHVFPHSLMVTWTGIGFLL